MRNSEESHDFFFARLKAAVNRRPKLGRRKETRNGDSHLHVIARENVIWYLLISQPGYNEFLDLQATPAQRSGGQCICAAPNTLCNGNCVPPTFNCPSSVAPDRRRWDGASECNSRGGGHMACGVYGRGARVWECIDTDNDLESCKFSAELIDDDRV